MNREFDGPAVFPRRQPPCARAFLSQRGEGMTEYIIIIAVVMFCGILMFFNTLVSAGNMLVTWSGCLFCDEHGVVHADDGLVDDVPVDSNQPALVGDDFDAGNDLLADAGVVANPHDWGFWWDDSFSSMWDWMSWTDEGFGVYV